MKRLKKPLIAVVMLALLFAWIPVRDSRVHAETWNAFEGSAVAGLSADTTQNAYSPYMLEFAGDLYAIWYEGDGPAVIRVMKYDELASEWTAEDGGGLNADLAQFASFPKLAVVGDKLYAAWAEDHSGFNGFSQIRVKEYAGNATWVAVDGGGLNYDTGKNAYETELVGYEGELYAFWLETNGTFTTLRAKKLSGSTWESVDGNQTLGLNNDVNATASKVDALAFGGKLYVSWTEAIASDTIDHIWVKEYDGSAWTLIGGDQDGGLNRDGTKEGFASTLAIFDNELYIFWSENQDQEPGQIRAMRYAGGTAWSFADGDNDDTGLNRNPVRNAWLPGAVELNGMLYATWLENDEVRVAKYDGADWSFADGGEDNGLNGNDVFLDGASPPVLAVHDGRLFAAWSEDVGGQMKVRIREMAPDPTVAVELWPEPGATDVAVDTWFELKFADGKIDAAEDKFIRLYDENDNIVELYNAHEEDSVEQLEVTDLEYDEDDEVYYFYPSDDLAYETTYYFEIDEGAFEDDDGLKYAGIDDKTTWSFTTGEQGPPELDDTYPEAGDTDVAIDTNLYLEFDQDVTAVAGKYIYVRNSDDEAVETIEATDADAVEIDDDEVTVYLSGPLAYSSLYYVEVDEGAFASAGGNFAGISGSGEWSFTTANPPAPQLQQYTPIGAGVSTVSNLTLRFDQDVTAQADKYLYIRKSDATLVEQIAVDDSTLVTVAGDRVTVNPAGVLEAETSYYVELDQGAFIGTGSEFEGIYGDGYWTFATGPALVKGDGNGDGKVTPADALIVNKYVQGKIALTAEQLYVLDMDEDDDVDADDAKLILELYQGKGA